MQFNPESQWTTFAKAFVLEGSRPFLSRLARARGAFQAELGRVEELIQIGEAIRVGRPEKVRSVIEDMTLEAELKRLKESEEGDRGTLEEDQERAVPGKGGKSGGKFGKFGKSGKSGDVDLGAQAQRHFEDRRAQSRQDFELQMKILREAEVICTTTIAGGMDFLARLSNFEAILVDEVAQATELSTAVPVVLRGANRLVLVGDHCQLPPAVLSPEAELRGLSVSVYSRLVQAGGLKPFLLDTQYRSHPKLAEFSSHAFYDGLLKSGIEESQRALPMGVPWPNAKCPIAFINVDAQEELEGDSKANSVEAQLVASLVGKVFQYGELNVSQVGVVTPYMAQVRRLRQMLRPVIPPGADFRLLECASVDNFQGREKELIVFSAVRSNRAGNVGFLADWRRLNVMLTRARRGLLIFGNAQTLKQDPIWHQWLTFAEQHECIVKDLPMPTPPSGANGKGMRPMPWGKGKVGGPRPQGRNPLLAAQEAARAAAEVSADLRQRADVSQEVRPPGPGLLPWMSQKPSRESLQIEDQLQQFAQVEAQLNQRQQALQQQQLQAAQLLFVNPIMANLQMQQIQKETLELQGRWSELSTQRAQLQEQKARAHPDPARSERGENHFFVEHQQIEELLERQLGM
ncbi:Regulator of nonsense transcripts 1 homolog (ATP-dependent helicase UPF1) [Durusdinium trenchii]|uniref:Regulator of nonsense transcripts 1 homolog (ATP-dependent helicase UPF1) n=1 Tax=Durusdinium trenchii TaxID=1381693 RepID=A0ABP0IXG1_9DINO